MDTKNQFSVFLLCVGIGIFGGILYELFWLIGLPFCKKGKRKWLRILLDTLFWISFAFIAVLCAYLLKFPSLRVYMCIGYACGGIIYIKILRIIVAFWGKLWYNRHVKKKKEQ